MAPPSTPATPAVPPSDGQFHHSTIALIYDFDGTLTPLPMQEYTVLPQLGLEPQPFWQEVLAETRRTNADKILTYMRLLVEKSLERNYPLSRADLARLAADIEYFPGVKTWFTRMNRYVRSRSKGRVVLNHYIISAGLQEILDGVSIRKHFEQVYGCAYYFDEDGFAIFPRLVINDTTKTQFLFRINKGREELQESIHEYMPHEQRRVPFANMIYIGDGMTDVPCMAVMNQFGGHAIAVYTPDEDDALHTCKDLCREKRIDFYAQADYRAGSILETRVKLILDLTIARINHAAEVFHCRQTAGE